MSIDVLHPPPLPPPPPPPPPLLLKLSFHFPYGQTSPAGCANVNNILKGVCLQSSALEESFYDTINSNEGLAVHSIL